MKIGILTYQFSTQNFGAVLQTYASYRVLKKLGHTPEVINLLPGKKLSFKKNLKAKLKLFLYNKIEFERFKKKHIKLSAPYYSDDNLHELDTIFYAYYVGSDQVWRASMSKERLIHYFLDFADNEKLKIAYAASFGISSWEGDTEKTKQVTPLIKRFSAIGVREQDGVDICKNVFNVNAVKVLDPTLLLDEGDYQKIIQKNEKFNLQNYIAYHIIQDRPAKGAIPSMVFQQTKKKVINLFGQNKKILGHSFLKYNSIGTWLDGIQNASLIITDSFHCVIFSIIFKKQFVCIPNQRGGVSRIENLLQMLRLEDRFCESENFDIKFYLNSPINYSEVYSNLNLLRKESFNFLTNALL
ncbi:hypothetical protein HNR65_001807 [Desulfosalsimonas propionicica]|uniref:Polysaccharide pyruvyl transferase domain-containing protein n=1 Tax=Desulfosalsimonas propionicica TaxID=332175 RepID=A0A7W0HKR0_9BACT|nr:polysaccharide pyruvyl transferase family protein [Desulfosalsimonas propionicica]MBA2881480.1 hypothetical protein [Desulfosalsimonas propionicica]